MKRITKVFVFLFACVAVAALFIGYARIQKRATSALAPELVVKQSVRVSAAVTNAAEPALVSRADGSVCVVWVEHKSEEADVVFSAFSRTGDLIVGPTRVNPDAGTATAWRGSPPAIALGPSGSIYVAWTARPRPAGSKGSLYISVSTNGGKSFETPAKMSYGNSVAAGMQSNQAMRARVSHRVGSCLKATSRERRSSLTTREET